MFESMPITEYDRKCRLLFNLYNRYAEKYGMPRAFKLTRARKSVMVNVKKYKLSDLKLFLRQLKLSSDLLSNVDWFNFDWVIKEDNFVKVMEGKYVNTIKFVKHNIDSEIKYIQKEY